MPPDTSLADLPHPEGLTLDDTAAGDAARPREYGVGARFSIFPMTDDFVDVILGALASAARPPGLQVETDDVSTFVAGAEADVGRFLRDVVALAADAAGGRHLAAHVLLSRGCPGEVTCAAELGGRPWAPDELPVLPPTGHRAAAHWSLYPLADPDPTRGGGAAATDDGDRAGSPHMEVIEAAVARARADGTYAGSGHFVTRLEGDVAAVLGTALGAWVHAGAEVQHVVTHLTLSIDSPTSHLTAAGGKAPR